MFKFVSSMTTELAELILGNVNNGRTDSKFSLKDNLEQEMCAVKIRTFQYNFPSLSSLKIKVLGFFF